jgi:protein-L-isoaspartate(D-aspartate) O-methyltransferase
MIIAMVSFDQKDRFAAERASMVRNHMMARDITDPAVLEVMGQIPREQFLSGQYLDQAYADRPLPIGLGQTISQPYIVALMTQYLKLNNRCHVLEIGTGSGYQTAILAKLAKKVYTIERLNQLTEMAQTNLAHLKIDNVEFFIGDGSCGWPEEKGFDRIIITAAIPQIPEPVPDQLKDNGLLVAPIGGELSQDLVVCEKTHGQLTVKSVCGCRFVKLIGKYGFSEQ